MKIIFEEPIESAEHYFFTFNGVTFNFTLYELFCEIIDSFYRQASIKYNVRNVLVCLTTQNPYPGCYLEETLRKHGYPKAEVMIELFEIHDPSESIEEFWFRQNISC